MDEVGMKKEVDNVSRTGCSAPHYTILYCILLNWTHFINFLYVAVKVEADVNLR